MSHVLKTGSVVPVAPTRPLFARSVYLGDTRVPTLEMHSRFCATDVLGRSESTEECGFGIEIGALATLCSLAGLAIVTHGLVRCLDI